MSAPPCPSLDDWQAFTRGACAEPRLETLADHLGSCAECCSRLAAIEDECWEPAPDQNGPPGPIGGPPGPCACTGDRFHLQECLGVGGLGAVYRAFDRMRGHDVALKLLLPHAALDARGRGRFANKARLTRIDHPHVIRIFEMARAGSQDFLVMESARVPRWAAGWRHGGIPCPCAWRCGSSPKWRKGPRSVIRTG